MIKEVKKYALGLEYIGTNLKGWQRQKKGHTTIQDIVEKSLSKFLDQKISTICSGRTDSGVHALNQTVHFETSKSRTDESFLKGLNSLMGPQVKVIWIKKVDKDFSARFSAIKRRYRYVIEERSTGSVFSSNYSLSVQKKINVSKLKKASKFLIGENNFSSFRSSSCQSKSPFRNIESIKISRKGEFIFFDITGNAFLHNMIRIIMGTLIMISDDNLNPDIMKKILAAKDRNLAGKTITSKGLFYFGPEYPKEMKIPCINFEHSSFIF